MSRKLVVLTSSPEAFPVNDTCLYTIGDVIQKYSEFLIKNTFKTFSGTLQFVVSLENEVVSRFASKKLTKLPIRPRSGAALERSTTYPEEKVENKHQVLDALHCPHGSGISTVFASKIQNGWTDRILDRLCHCREDQELYLGGFLSEPHPLMLAECLTWVCLRNQWGGGARKKPGRGNPKRSRFPNDLVRFKRTTDKTSYCWQEWCVLEVWDCGIFIAVFEMHVI